MVGQLGTDGLEAGFWPSSGGPITHPQSVIDLPESSFLTKNIQFMLSPVFIN
jgi:hypothetical protein